MAEFLTIEGIEEVCDSLRYAPKEAMPVALLAGLRAGADIVERTVVTFLASHERDDRIGGDAEFPSLMDDLGTTITLDGEFRGGIAQIGFGNQSYVALFVEYGHYMVGHKPLKKPLGKKVIAQPFLRPGFDASKEAAAEALIEAMLEVFRAWGIVDGD